MFILKNKSALWWVFHLLLPVTAIIPFLVYYQTLFTHVYPGISAFLTASAADLCQKEDLSYPLFTLITRAIADLPFATLPVRLNFFCALCGAITVSLFYWMTTRLILLFACESPGGAMNAVPHVVSKGLDADNNEAETIFADNFYDTFSVPLAVLEHNQRALKAAVLGGLAAAVTLAFCAPFWLVSTRLYPYTFDLMLFCLIVNLLLSYDQQGKLTHLFIGIFLLAVCCLESPLFILLAFSGGLFLVRTMYLNEQATTYKVLFAVLTGLAGGLLACYLVWLVAGHCAVIPTPAFRSILHVLLPTLMDEFLQWVPRLGWSYDFVLLLLPCAIAFYVFFHSFRQRTPLLFFLQLLLVGTFIPNLLNLRFSLWNVSQHTFIIPIYSYVVIALMVGGMVAVWHLMREVKNEPLDPNELDFYEYKDNAVVSRIGAWLCWPLLLMVCLVPFRSMQYLNTNHGVFADAIAEEMYRELGPRNWLVNNTLLQHHLLILAHQDGRRLHFISTRSATKSSRISPLTQEIQGNPSFAAYRYRLQNAADLSATDFLREWLKREPLAYRDVVLFNEPSLWSDNGFKSFPTGFFLSGVPADATINTQQLLVQHTDFTEKIRLLLKPDSSHDFRFFSGLRQKTSAQLARMANELGVLLVADHKAVQAATLFEQAVNLDPDNLALLINHYYIATSLKINSENYLEMKERLRKVPQRVDVFKLNTAKIQTEYGTLIEPNSFDKIRRSLWIRTPNFRNLAINSTHFKSDSLTALQSKKNDLYQAIAKNMYLYEFDEADHDLNILLDLNENDPFALLNKARIAIERKQLVEAQHWMALAKTNGVSNERFVWYEASILVQGGQLDAGKKCVYQGIALTPDNIDLWILLAKILMRLDEYAEIESRVFPVLRSAYTKNEHFMMHVIRGYLIKQQGVHEYPAARNCFLRALSLNKNLPEIREEVLRIDDVLEVPAFCEKDAKEMLRFDPEHAFANFLWGTVRLRRGELELAKDLFLRSLAKDRSAVAYAGLGMVLLEQKDFNAAETLLRKAIAMDSSRTQTAHALARLLLATERIEEAAKVMDPVVSALPNNLDVLLTLIRLRMKQQRLEDAALLISALLDKNAELPQQIRQQLKPLAEQLSKKLAL